MIAGVLVVLIWLALIVFVFCLCDTAGDADDRIENFGRGPGGWRH